MLGFSFWDQKEVIKPNQVKIEHHVTWQQPSSTQSQGNVSLSLHRNVTLLPWYAACHTHQETIFVRCAGKQLHQFITAATTTTTLKDISLFYVCPQAQLDVHKRWIVKNECGRSTLIVEIKHYDAVCDSVLRSWGWNHDIMFSMWSTRMFLHVRCAVVISWRSPCGLEVCQHTSSYHKLIKHLWGKNIHISVRKIKEITTTSMISFDAVLKMRPAKKLRPSVFATLTSQKKYFNSSRNWPFR